MFRFFRNIRQNLLAENKTVRYLKYAVGEILLVMIGILLALQVNNWNEGKKLEQQRQELIENLKADFQVNSERLDQSIVVTDSMRENIDILLKVSAGELDSFSTDEIRGFLRHIFSPIGFQPAMSSFNAANNIGLMNQIKDKPLQELFLMFEFWYQAYLGHGDVRLNDVFAGSTRELRDELGSLNAFYGSSRYKPKMYTMNDADYMAFIRNKKFYSWAENIDHIISRMSGQLRNLKETTEQILTALEALD